MPTSVSEDRRLAKALNHPLRAQVYAQLKQDEASPLDLAQRIGAPLTKVAYHVRVLVDAGLAEQTPVKPVRGALQHFYAATEVEVACTALNIRLRPSDAVALTQRICDLVGEYDEDWSGDVIAISVQPGPLD